MARARGGPKALPLALQANASEHGLDQAEILENAYVEPRKTSAGTVLDILASPGLSDFATLSASGVRAIYPRDTDALVVAGANLSKVTTAGAVTSIGSVPASGHVSIAQNRANPVQYGICFNGTLYMYTNTTLTQVMDADLLAPNSVCFHGGYFVISTLTGALQASEINDGTAWDALDYDYAQKSSDGLYRVISRGADIVAFGPKSMEFWVQYAPEIGLPFQFSTAKSAGLLAPGGLAQVAYTTPTGTSDVWVFPATSHEGKYTGICVLEGYSLNKISHPGVDRDIEDESDPTSLVATSWVQGGHGFYCISGTAFSWQFDTYMGKWYRRSSYDASRWRVSQVAALGQDLIAGHHNDTALYTMARGTHDEAGDPLIWRVRTPRLHAFPSEIELNELHADVIPGVGLASGDDENINPSIMMRWTEDGENWSSERWRSMGVQGAGRQDVRWNGLGTCRKRGRIFEFSASAAVVRGLRGASFPNAVALPP